MHETDATASWFAVTTKPRHEKAVAMQFDTKSLEQYLPLFRVRRPWSDRVKTLDLPLFPGYVFCRFTFADRFQVLRTMGVGSIVGFGGVPMAVPDVEIEAVKAMVGSGLPVYPWPFLRVGQRVRINDGSLYGLEGILLREKGLVRVVVSVELLQRSVAVEIDRAAVQAVAVA